MNNMDHGYKLIVINKRHFQLVKFKVKMGKK